VILILEFAAEGRRQIQVRRGVEQNLRQNQIPNSNPHP
jgi:hypothetical protein